MAIIKKYEKLCAGWDGNSHPAFLWKKINGKGYCKKCSAILDNKKSFDDRQIKNNETKKQFNLFLEIWNERKINGRNYCEVSGEILPKEALSIYFDHLLEKNKYPQFRYDKRNIIIVSGDVHTLKTNGNPLKKHKELIEKAKKELL